ncbi:hypothetical protein MLK26_025315 [Escherichia coli]|nr:MULTISPECIES: hypothetical protein [Enterobacteriaceae]MCN2543066.1 hypothetical protein [Escherichia coli]MCN6282939.1 hypothetical protein [Escherichia coli]MCN6487554.1 hypothetical protein [Escherichia coli]MCN6982003.1 hypothetical protein [Escherichia coli]MCN7919529.1 hypothetical protein [Escherichia coli]
MFDGAGIYASGRRLAV